MLCEQGQNGQRERRGFAGAGLRGPDQIFAGKNNGERAQLNRRWFGKTHGLGSADDFRRKSEIVK